MNSDDRRAAALEQAAARATSLSEAQQLGQAADRLRRGSTARGAWLLPIFRN